ncbi:EVE domain-containing protein [Trichoderma simmonsii]|uniref:Thymocyte nuclear protein 1 n=1 Tax=Trichoderma simmonsii TaxID=1491479 RepID=A0A8G0LG12_9HYPO|nr:EVE domain-containing protein [Trichoderma simmonsii]
MPPRKRIRDEGEAAEPVAKRRSSRQAAASTKKAEEKEQVTPEVKKAAAPTKKRATTAKETKNVNKPTDDKKKPAKKDSKKTNAKNEDDEKASSGGDKATRAVSEDPNIDSIPAKNPDAPRHDGEWYWLMKAEPETRFENGIDVRFSIDDLRAKEKPEGWDGIRAYAARNHMRNMNQGDKAFFYHSNCKEPGIAGIMEIVKEFSEDKSARRPGTPYYDPQSSKDNVRWSLVHVEFRKKFAVPIGLKELRELGKPGGPLENMQMLKQGRLSVSRVSAEEWKALCEIADKKAEEAGLKHETTKLTK